MTLATSSHGWTQKRTVCKFLDVDRLGGGPVLDDELLEVEESLLMVRLLPHLHHSVPVVLRRRSVALVAVLIRYNILHHKLLLQNRRRKHLLLYHHFDLDALGMRLSPDEPGIYKPHLTQLQSLQTQRQELTRFKFACHIVIRRLKIAGGRKFVHALCLETVHEVSA